MRILVHHSNISPFAAMLAMFFSVMLLSGSPFCVVPILAQQGDDQTEGDDDQSDSDDAVPLGTEEITPQRSGIGGPGWDDANSADAEKRASSGHRGCGCKNGPHRGHKGGDGDNGESLTSTVTTHVLTASYYTQLNGLVPMITLSNKGPASITVRPTLYSLSGTSATVTPISVNANSFRTIDMRDWTTVAGSGFTQGSVQVSYDADGLVVDGQVRLVDTAHSLSLDEQMVEPASAFLSSTLRTAWYLPTSGTKARVVLSNTGNASLTATVTIRSSSIVTKQYSLTAHQTRLLDLQADLLSGALPSSVGGLSISHSGAPGEIVAGGGAYLGVSGFSYAFEFSDPSNALTNTLQGAGFRIRNLGTTQLTPMIVAYNATTSPVTISRAIPYKLDSGTEATMSLANISLNPNEARIISADISLSSAMRSTTASAGLNLSYNSTPGTVAVLALSQSADLNNVFRTPLVDPLAQQSSTGGYPWYVLNDSSTYVHVKNVSDVVQYFSAQMNFPGDGVYVLGVKRLNPQQSITFDIKGLRDGQVPDEAGTVLPSDAQNGQFLWSSEGDENLQLIGRGEQYNSAIGLGHTVGGLFCCPDSFFSGSVVPDPIDGAPGDTFLPSPRVRRINCYGTVTNWYDVVFLAWAFTPTPWHSSSSSIAVVDEATGATQLASLGNAILSVHFRARDWEFIGRGHCLLSVEDFIEDTPIDSHTVVTFEKGNGMAISPPLRIGLSSTTHNGTTHNRTQHLQARVAPPEQAASVIISGDGRVSVSNQALTSNGIITFDAVGITESGDRGDAKIEAKVNTEPVGSVSVTVVVPRKFVKSKAGTEIKKNDVFDLGSRPVVTGVPPGMVQRSTIYGWTFTVALLDYFGDPIGDLYADGEVQELLDIGWTPINQVVTPGGYYIDPVGIFVTSASQPFLPASDTSAIAAWRAQALLLPSGPLFNSYTVQPRIDEDFPLPPITTRVVNLSATGVITRDWP